MHDAWAKRLLYRWFVEYNPFYIVSAGCVVIGVNLISSSLGARSALTQIGVAAIAEAYTWALIASAAWLYRSGARRPAVMLALLVAVYQCDPTLHTETCAFLGPTGMLAGAGWFMSAIAKLRALLWALRLRASHSAVVIPAFGAFGLLVIPRCLPALDAGGASALIASWAFALLAAAAWTRRSVTSLCPLDAWGKTVLRRGTRAAWVIGATLTTSHVLFWLDELELAPWLLAPVALLIATRWIRSELGVWCAVLASCALAALATPAILSAVALMAAVTLALRALREPILLLPPELAAGPSTPYRVANGARRPAGEPELEPVLAFTRAAPAAFARLLVGSVSGAYLALWTLGWQGGAWPEHALVLDALLALALLLLASRARFRIAVFPLLANLLHLGVERGFLSAPDTAVEWGVTWVASGFGLLFSSLLVTWRLKKDAGDPQWSSSTQPPAR